MNRTTVALFAALEAVIAVAVGIGLALVPLTVLWAVQFGLGIDWVVFWRAAADVWLVGNGTDLTVALGQATATGLGVPSAGTPFTFSIAALGFAVLAVVFGVRTGIRAGETVHRRTGVIVAVIVYGVLAVAISVSAAVGPVRPTLWQGVTLPVAIYAVAVVTGSVVGRARSGGADAVPPAVGARFARSGPEVRAGAAAAVRAGTAATALVLALSAVLVAILLVANYAHVVSMYEGLQTGILGGAVLTLAQLAFLPNAIIWAASWLVGPGFAIGTGSSVGPLGTQLGLVPPVPLFGILPQGDLALGFLGLAVPVVAGFVAGLLIRSRLRSSPGGMLADLGTGRLALTGVGIGVVAGIQLGLLAWWSSGALGPGRLHDVGPNPWLVGALAAAEVACAAVVGILAGGRDSRIR